VASKFTSSGVSFINTSGALTTYQAPHFTNPSGAVVVLSSLCSNTSPSSNLEITSQIYQGSTLVSTIAHRVVVPSGSSLELIPNKVILASGQRVSSVILPSGTNSLTTSVMELY
jgi:hypothetical protein